jgi:hypothetical protein
LPCIKKKIIDKIMKESSMLGKYRLILPASNLPKKKKVRRKIFKCRRSQNSRHRCYLRIRTAKDTF